MDVSVPLLMIVLSSRIIAVVEELRLSANSVGSFSISSLDIESALFHAPGQCTTVMLNCAKKSLILRTARFMELCMNRRLRLSENK